MHAAAEREPMQGGRGPSNGSGGGVEGGEGWFEARDELGSLGSLIERLESGMVIGAADRLAARMQEMGM